VFILPPHHALIIGIVLNNDSESWIMLTIVHYLLYGKVFNVSLLYPNALYLPIGVWGVRVVIVFSYFLYIGTQIFFSYLQLQTYYY